VEQSLKTKKASSSPADEPRVGNGLTSEVEEPGVIGFRHDRGRRSDQTGSRLPLRSNSRRWQTRFFLMKTVVCSCGPGLSALSLLRTGVFAGSQRRRSLGRTTGRITGIRSCTGAISSFGLVVMMVQLSINSPSSVVLHVHKPANPKALPSSRRKWIGSFLPSGLTVHS